MTLETKLFSKLEPHAKRIKDGEGNDFDYLPAVLLQLMEVQKQQAQQLDDNAQLLDSIKGTVVSIGVASKTHIAAFELTAQTKLEQLEVAIKNTQTQIQNSQSSMSEQIDKIASAHAEHTKKTNEGLSKLEQLEVAIKNTQTQIQNSQSSMSEQIVKIASTHAEHTKKTNEGLSAIGLEIESLVSIAERSHVMFMRLLIAGLVASTVVIGLAIAILQRH